jgi:hypothetical protein
MEDLKNLSKNNMLSGNINNPKEVSGQSHCHLVIG